jgi:hypothetical protein
MRTSERRLNACRNTRKEKVHKPADEETSEVDEDDEEEEEEDADEEEGKRKGCVCL